MDSGKARKVSMFRLVLGASVGVSLAIAAYVLWDSKQPDPLVRQIAEQRNEDPFELQSSYDLLGKASAGALSQSEWSQLVDCTKNASEIVRSNGFAGVADQWDTKWGSQVPGVLDTMKEDPSQGIRDSYIWRKALARVEGWESEAEELAKTGNERERKYANDALKMRDRLARS